MSKRVQYLTISDVHLGHPRNPTENIINNLLSFFDQFSDKSPFCRLDIIFIVGDLLDRLIDASQTDLYDILVFIDQLIRFCERHQIKLRVLEGTPSHDRQQNRLIESVKRISSTKADVKWINTLCIEDIQDLELSVLYIPDEFTASTETTLEIVKSLMKEQKRNQVDIAMMHGMFQYQMQGIPGRHDTHNEFEYLNLVQHFISIGHIHTHSNYERIIAQGSFDRLAHGEEEPKGAVLCTIREDDEDYYQFLENTNAKIFKTIEIDSNIELSEYLKQIRRLIDKVPNESYIRIKGSREHAIWSHLPDLKKQYPFIHFTKLSKEDELEETEVKTISSEYEHSVIEIRQENVVSLLMDEIKQQNTLSDIEQNNLCNLLSTLANI